jgi:hypothetical protein
LQAKFPRFSLLQTARALASGPSRPPTPEELANANYGTPISQAEAEVTVWNWLFTVLKDPGSMQIWTKVKKGWYQDPPSEGGRMHFVYQLFVSINAKNSSGGYTTGLTDYRFSFFNGQIVAIHKGQIVRISEQESGEYWHIDLVGSERIGP